MVSPNFSRIEQKRQLPAKSSCNDLVMRITMSVLISAAEYTAEQMEIHGLGCRVGRAYMNEYRANKMKDPFRRNNLRVSRGSKFSRAFQQS